MIDDTVTITLSRSDARMLCHSMAPECPYCYGPSIGGEPDDYTYRHDAAFDCPLERIKAAARAAIRS